MPRSSALRACASAAEAHTPADSKAQKSEAGRRYEPGEGPHRTDVAREPNQSKAEGKPVTPLSEAKVMPSGVVRLMELQKQGYAYIRP